VTNGTITTQYAYDGMGHRVSQAVNGVLSRYLLDVQPELEYVLAATTGSATERYVHGPTGIHAMENAAGNWLWAGQDALGNVRFEADESLAVLSSREIDSYQNPFNEQGVFDLPFVGTGEIRDDIGLQYHRKRYMNPVLGAFISLDPFEGMAQRPMSLNGYSWVEGNTPNLVDPSGGCGQPTNWFDPIDANCYYSADGLARRFSNGDATAYQSWFNALIQKSWTELKAIEALGSAADVTGASRQLLDNAAIIPSLFRENPAAALQALETFACQNRGNLYGITATAIIATVAAATQYGTMSASSATLSVSTAASGGGGFSTGGIGVAIVGGVIVAVGGLLLWDELTRPYEFHLPGFEKRVNTLAEHLAKLLEHDVAGHPPTGPNPDGRANRAWCVTIRRVILEIDEAGYSERRFNRDLEEAGFAGNRWGEIVDALKEVIDKRLCDDHWDDFNGGSFATG
jgi:RHS repeat-associated protein